MNQEDKQRLVQGMFSGADLSSAQINVFVEDGAKVVYKEIIQSKNEAPQVTNEQIANAIRAINGKDKPLNQYNLWLGVCSILSWKYGYPRNLGECCERINSLPLEGVEYICKYENIRKFPATHAFMKEDARNWNSYTPKTEERKLFNECLSVAQAFEAEIQKQIEAE